MRYIIMADGKGIRWDNFTDCPKHLITINGETLLERLVRQLKSADFLAEIIITSRDDRYEVEGARRHVPLNNEVEIDRFTQELIRNDICFLYGDTYYTDEAIQKIIAKNTDSVAFFGNIDRIFAVKAFDGEFFGAMIARVKIDNPDGKGWDVYQVFSGLKRKEIGQNYFLINDETTDFNTPTDYLDFVKATSF